MSVGTFSLGDIAVTTADTYVGPVVLSLAGALGLTVQLRFEYGTGGTDARAYVQVSLDQGSTFIDIACVLFGTVSETAVLNFSGLTPSLFSNSPPSPLAPTDGALADNTAVDGVIGDRVRVKVVTTGTFATQTLLSSRVTVR